MRFLRVATPFLAVAAVGLAACTPDSGKKIDVTFINPTAAATVTPVPQSTDTPRPQATIAPRPTDTPRPSPTPEIKKSPQDLVRALLTRPIELGASITNISAGELDPTAKTLNAVGKVIALVSITGSSGLKSNGTVSYTVFTNPADATAAHDVARNGFSSWVTLQGFEQRGTRSHKPGMIQSAKVVVPIGNVLVSVDLNGIDPTTSNPFLDPATRESEWQRNSSLQDDDAILLARRATEHLKNIER